MLHERIERHPAIQVAIADVAQQEQELSCGM